MTTTELPEDTDKDLEPAKKAPPKLGPNGEKPVCRSLCGWCGSGNHEKCKDMGGFILFTNGIYSGNQCKCHDLAHEYVIAGSADQSGKPAAKRKTKR